MTNKEENPELYKNETRTLRDRQGMDRVVTMKRIYWGSYEFLLRESNLTMGDMLAIADEEAPTHKMTWHEYFPEGLSCMDHYYMQRPELWTSNLPDADKLVGYIGPVSKVQIEALEKKKTPVTGDNIDTDA